MGYRCPVCGDPQADDVHLANHLAFTAMLRGGDHEAWLDDRVADWDRLGEEELSVRVTDHADETDYPQVFEDTTDADHDHTDSRATDLPDGVAVASETRADEEVREIIEEAREMTRERRADDDSDQSAERESAQGENQTEEESAQGED